MTQRIAVVGAGWSGLAAAVELSAAGVECTLFEAGRVPGGRARSLTLDGRRLDNGQHILLGAYRETLALMRRVGASEERLLWRTPLCVSNAEDFHLELPDWPAPWNLAYGLLNARGASLEEKWRVFRRLRQLKARGWQVDEGLSVAAWLEAENVGLSRKLWHPLCLAAMNTSPQIASAQVFVRVLRDSLGSSARGATDLLLPRVPLEELLPLPACDWLRRRGASLRFGERLRNVTVCSDGYVVQGERFDQLIVTVAPQHVAKLLAHGDSELSEWSAGFISFEYEPIATLYFEYPEVFRLVRPLLHLGGTGQWAVDRGAVAASLNDAGLVAVVLSGQGDWQTLDNDALCAETQAEIAALHPGLKPPRWQRVLREQRATFSCRPRLRRPSQRTNTPGLWLAGDYCWQAYPATLEGAVRSGLRAAHLALGIDSIGHSVAD